MALMLLSAILTRMASAGCHTDDINFDVPTLGLLTENTNYGDTNDKVYGRILSGTTEALATWSDWRKLDNSNCDDHEKGKTDYHDDFEDIEDPWLAVALYNCGTDGWALSGLEWWDGDSWSDNEIDEFCGNIAGPSRECYKGEDAADTCDSTFGDPIYGYVFLDQNGNDCTGVSIATGQTSSLGNPVGGVWYKSNPGVPDCSGEYGAYKVVDRRMKKGMKVAPVGAYKVGMEEVGMEEVGIEEVSAVFGQMNVLIGAVALLVLSNAIVITVLVQRCVRERDRPRYSKVDMESS